jgi:hypothetical protein
MKNLVLLSLVFARVSAVSQVTINNSDFPTSGDTALVSVANIVDVDLVSTGEDYTWNFDFLTRAEQRINTFNNVGAASLTYQLVFNNGWFDPDYEADYYQNLLNFSIPSTEPLIGISIDKPVGFTKIESDRVETVGVGLEIEGFQVPVKYDTIDLIYELPFSYADNWDGTAYFEIDMNPIYDGILRRRINRSTVVDGWGKVTTPFGTFDVVRAKSTIEYTDSLRISFADTEIWLPIPTPTEVVYSWWGKEQKIPILEIITQDVLGTATTNSIEYKDRYYGEVGLENEELNTFQLYPNPATDIVNITCDGGVHSFTMVNLAGQEIMHHSFKGSHTSISVAHLPTGTYFVKLVQDNKSSVQLLQIQ